MKPTALTELKEQIKQLKPTASDYANHGVDYCSGADSAYDIVISKILSLLPKERQDMEDAYAEGSYMNCQRHQFPPFTKQASDYFNQNFTQDITNQVK